MFCNDMGSCQNVARERSCVTSFRPANSMGAVGA
jgi:hypothetical protein